MTVSFILASFITVYYNLYITFSLYGFTEKSTTLMFHDNYLCAPDRFAHVLPENDTPVRTVETKK